MWKTVTEPLTHTLTHINKHKHSFSLRHAHIHTHTHKHNAGIHTLDNLRKHTADTNSNTLTN